MIWVAIGVSGAALLVVLIGLAAIADLSEKLGSLRGQLDDVPNWAGIDARIAYAVADAARTKPPRVPAALDTEQRSHLQAAWAQVQCRACGLAHQGLCPRIRRAEWDSAGRLTRTWFWPNGEWEPPPDALTAADVFGSPAGGLT